MELPTARSLAAIGRAAKPSEVTDYDGLKNQKVGYYRLWHPSHVVSQRLTSRGTAVVISEANGCASLVLCKSHVGE